MTASGREALAFHLTAEHTGSVHPGRHPLRATTAQADITPGAAG